MRMLKGFTWLCTLAMVFSFGLTMTGCGDSSSDKPTTEQIKDGADTAADKIKDGAEATKDAAKDAVDATKDAAEDLKKETGEALEKAGEDLQN